MASTLGTSCNGSAFYVNGSLRGNPVTNKTITCNHGINSVFPFDGISNDFGVSDDRNELDSSENALHNRQMIDDISENANATYCNINEFKELQRGNFNIFHMNSRSLSKNFDEIIDYLSLLNCDFDAIGFTETWSSDNISPFIKIDGCNMVESHSRNKKGGVALFIRDSFMFDRRDDISILMKT